MGWRRLAEWSWAVGCMAALTAGVYISSCGPSSEAPQKKVAAPAPPKPSAATVAPASVTANEQPSGDNKALPRGPVGWHAVYAAHGSTDAVVKTSSPYAAFALADNQSVHPGVPAAGLSASYAGEVTIEEAGKYRFAAQMKGGIAKLAVYQGSRQLAQASLSPDQSSVETPWIDVPAGTASVTVSFTRSGSGPARLRTVWQKAGVAEKGFLEEPIGPGYVTVARQGINDAESGRSALHGRVLIGELNCAACHDAGATVAAVSPRTAPLMGEIGRRASAEWLAKWVKDPQSMRPGTAMPTVFGTSPEDAAEADAIVHYLLSLGSIPEWEAAGTESQILADGARLYHSVGCVTCHGVLDDPGRVFGEDVAASGEKSEVLVPFGKVSGKWRPEGLAEFLVDPVRTHPSGRMPGMALNKSEADLIAGYLVNSWDPGGFKPAAFEPDKGKVEAGKAAFAARGCAACHQTGHQLPDVKSTLAAKPMAGLKAGVGCLDAADVKTPRYGLSENDRADIAAGLAELKTMNLPAAAPIDVAHRLVEALNCRACHEINEVGGVAPDLRSCFRTVDDADLGDEGRFPPRLTGAGMKLTTQYITGVLMKASRARPYMQTRMPQFGAANVAELPGALALMEGVIPESDVSAPAVTDASVIAGRTLVGEKGMNCISCHVYSGKMAGTPGPDITGFADHLRYEWWKPYLMSPTRFKPMTRMTAFYHQADGKGQIKDVFGGDFDRQAEAMWAYFTAKSGPAPEGLPSASGLPLVVGAKPTVFRTFLKDGGSRGIAVGYPIGVHFGFDGTGVRLVNAWKGEFIDATSTWKGRGGMTAGGQGKTIWKAPAGPAIVIGKRPEAWPEKGGAEGGHKFVGYRMNDRGAPSFLYKVGECDVEEQFEPAEQGLIKRTFTVKGVPAAASVWLNTGPGVLKSEAIANVAEDRVAGDDKVKLNAYTPKEAGVEMKFAVTIRPEVK
jgi:mono/diheme cytochrome c family protein